MATTGGGGGPFDLFQVDILEKLRVDRDWFALCVGDFYHRVAEAWDCDVELSEFRLQEACDYWLDDVERTQTHGFAGEHQSEVDTGPIELDHFKHAAILTFWLRRLLPINACDPIPDAVSATDGAAAYLSDEQKHFLHYGSETCALLFGFEIALNYEIQAYAERLARSGQSLDPDARLQLIREIRMPRRFVFEYPKLLKHKNFSWHALYMFYRGFFDKFAVSR